MKKIKKNLHSYISDKKYRPVHGFTLGAILVLLQSFWALLAIVGSVLMIVSAFLLILSRAKSKR